MRICAEISWGVHFLPSISTDQSVPMWRLTELMVRSTLVTAWRLATSPTRISPDLLKATTDGVVRAPSAFSITVGSPPSSVAMQEFVVPKSIPTARPICSPLLVVLLSTSSLNRHRPKTVPLDASKLEPTSLNFELSTFIPGCTEIFSHVYPRPEYVARARIRRAPSPMIAIPRRQDTRLIYTVRKGYCARPTRMTIKDTPNR